jgi:hypothetical protein
MRPTVLMALVALWVLWLLQPAVAQAPETERGRRFQESVRTATVHWENVPLREAIERLSRAFDQIVWVDRRLDPGRRIRLRIEDATLEKSLSELAAANGWGACRVGTAFYLGPANKANQLNAVAARRRDEIRSIARAERSALERNQPISWARLAMPRELVVEAIHERGFQVRGDDAIPHDLWTAGRLPPLELADQLSLLLIGFDLSFRIDAKERMFAIVPLDGDLSEAADRRQDAAERRQNDTSPLVRPSIDRQRGTSAVPETRQVYTLRVEEQPVGAVLRQLAERLDWRLDIEEDAIREAGISLDQRVSFSVQSADEDELLEALLSPAQLTFEHDGGQMRIIPKEAAANRN